MTRKKRLRSERGAAAVEFAVVLPVLLAIVFGAIDWGYYFFVREIVVNAAREGARVGTLQIAAPATPEGEAKAAADAYLSAALNKKATSIVTDARPDGAACPPTSSCVLVTYDLGGSVSGFLGDWVPKRIVAFSQMRK